MSLAVTIAQVARKDLAAKTKTVKGNSSAAMIRNEPPKAIKEKFRYRRRCYLCLLNLSAIFLILTMQFGNAWSGEPGKSEVKNENQQSNTEQKGSEKVAIFVNDGLEKPHGTANDPIIAVALPAIDSEEDTRQKHYERDEKPSLDRWVTWSTVALAASTFLLFCFTAGLWWVTYQLSHDAKDAGARQSEEMQKSIAEATRAATAMEKMAEAASVSSNAASESVAALKARTAQQMRAYLTVLAGNGIYQEREKQLRFAVHPTLLNSGHTPASNMSYWAKATILPFPLPEEFEFTIHENPIKSSMVIGPQQSVILDAVVDGFVPDGEVADIKIGTTRRVHIWGIVTYSDVFNEVHTTRFCHSIRWFGSAGDEKTAGTYSFRHNEVT